MHRLVHRLTLVALLFAPFAAPAAGMAAPPTVAECVEMATTMTGHEVLAGELGQAKNCCIAVPPAIDPTLATFDAVDAIDHLAYLVAIQSLPIGVGPKTEDPPPRIA